MAVDVRLWTARAAWVGHGPHLDGPGPWVEGGPLLATWWAGCRVALAASAAATPSAVVAVTGLLAPSSLTRAQRSRGVAELLSPAA